MAERMASRFPSGKGNLQLLPCERPVSVTETPVHPLGGARLRARLPPNVALCRHERNSQVFAVNLYSTVPSLILAEAEELIE
jgi:hypothetical protein